MDARTAGAFAQAPWDMINHLAATIPGARAYQHHLSGDLFVLTHIHLLRMRWELHAAVCVHVCIYVDIALLQSAGSLFLTQNVLLLS